MALINWAQPVVFLWIVLANALGIMAVVGMMARPGYSRWLSLSGLGGLLVLLALGERSGLGAALVALFGQIVVSMSVGVIGMAFGSAATRPGIGATTAASGLGMLLLLVLYFLYYGNYQFDIPGGTSVVPPISVAVVFLCLSSAIPSTSRRPARATDWTPAASAFLLLILPLGYLAAWDEPEPVLGSGFPVRVMSYNLHQGFDMHGFLAIKEQVKAIEEQHPDILALQEVSRGWVIDGSFDMLVWLSRRLDMPYVWGPAADSVWGNAILSRYPFSSAQDRPNSSALTQPMPNNSRLQMKRSFTTAQVDLGDGESLRVIATYLHHRTGEGHLRVPQVQALIQAWNSKERTVLMGDLNASPEASAMVLLAEAGLADAFLQIHSPSSPLPAGGELKGYTAPSDDALVSGNG